MLDGAVGARVSRRVHAVPQSGVQNSSTRTPRASTPGIARASAASIASRAKGALPVIAAAVRPSMLKVPTNVMRGLNVGDQLGDADGE